MSQLAYDKRQAAEACGVSEDTIKKAVDAGHLKAKRTARKGGAPDGDGVGKYLILASELSRWLESLADA